MFGKDKRDRLGKRLVQLEAMERTREQVELSAPSFLSRDPQTQHQQAVLADFRNAVRTNDQAERLLRDAERMAAAAALALVEARKRMRRVTDGLV